MGCRQEERVLMEPRIGSVDLAGWALQGERLWLTSAHRRLCTSDAGRRPGKTAWRRRREGGELILMSSISIRMNFY